MKFSRFSHPHAMPRMTPFLLLNTDFRTVVVSEKFHFWLNYSFKKKIGHILIAGETHLDITFLRLEAKPYREAIFTCLVLFIHVFSRSSSLFFSGRDVLSKLSYFPTSRLCVLHVLLGFFLKDGKNKLKQTQNCFLKRILLFM